MDLFWLLQTHKRPTIWPKKINKIVNHQPGPGNRPHNNQQHEKDQSQRVPGIFRPTHGACFTGHLSMFGLYQRGTHIMNGTQKPTTISSLLQSMFPKPENEADGTVFFVGFSGKYKRPVFEFVLYPYTHFFVSGENIHEVATKLTQTIYQKAREHGEFETANEIKKILKIKDNES